MKALRAVVSVTQEEMDKFLAAYEIFGLDIMTPDQVTKVNDYYHVLNHLCALGDVEKMYIPPVYDIEKGVYANQMLFEDDMIEKLEAGPGDVFLEVGCGRGRIAHHVASQSGAKVIGMNIDDGA
jgi:sterol 24-C-methyltransferase